jgi:hypothetical protein
MKNTAVKWLLAFFFVSATLLIHSCTRKEEKIFFQVSSSTVTVYGYVKDFEGNPVPDAEITILPTGDTIKSDKDGIYRFSLGLGDLPQDAVIYFKVSKTGFVPALSSVSFAEILEGTNNDVAVQKRVKRQDVILYPPAQLTIEVVDQNNKPVSGSKVLVFPSPSIANYLGVSQAEYIASMTSQSSPVSITDKVPAIDFVGLVAFPPEGKEDVYSVSFAGVDVSKGKANGKIVLKLQPLEIIYSSVDTGQFISPNSNITLVFSKEVTGFQGSLTCYTPIEFRIEFKAEITGAVVSIDPFGVLLGNCRLEVRGAFGKDGETLSSSPVIYNFLAYDPNAPRGLACPIPEVNLASYGSNSTEYAFDSPNKLLIFQRSIFSFDGFNLTFPPNLNLSWSPTVIAGIKDYKIKVISESDKQKGVQVWQDISVIWHISVTPQINLNTKKWEVSIPIPSSINLENGEKFYIAVIPVNINDEEICNPENINNPFTVADNIGPEITGVSGFNDYSTRQVTVAITFQENIAGGTIEITSRTFKLEKLHETISGSTAQLSLYIEPITFMIPNITPENSDGDNKLVFDYPVTLWVNELVNIYNSDRSSVFNKRVTGIEKFSDGNTIVVWFDSGIGSSVTNGAVEPLVANTLQSPSGNFYVSGGQIKANTTTGLTVGDKIQYLDINYLDINGSTNLTIKRVDNTGTIEVEETLPTLKCNSSVQCRFRSLNPDIKIKANVYDTSGNRARLWADESNHNGTIKW